MPFDSPFSALVALRPREQITLAESALLDAPGGTLALGQLAINPNDWPAGSSFALEVVLSVSLGSLTGTLALYNVTDAEAVTGAAVNTSVLTPTKFNTGALTVGAAAGNLKNGERIYEVRLSVTGTLVTDIVSLGSAFLLVQ